MVPFLVWCTSGIYSADDHRTRVISGNVAGAYPRFTGCMEAKGGTVLRVYTSAYCVESDTVCRRADRIRAQRPDLPVLVVDVDHPEVDVPATIVGTPMYTWNDRVLFLGHPSEREWLERRGGVHGHDS